MSSPSSAPLLQNNEIVLYDTINSYYAGIARIALAENNIEFKSYYVSMPTENIQPWFLRMNPVGQVPVLKTASGEVVADSRFIVSYAYGSEESALEKEVLDQLYSQDVGSLAWLSGQAKIPILNVITNTPCAAKKLESDIRKHQKANPDMREIYERKLAAISTKHFTKKLVDVASDVQKVVHFLEGKRAASTGQWLLGPDFGRVDALATAYLQWVLRCNAYGAAPITFPAGLSEYLERAKSRPAFQMAIGKYGEDAFVLTMVRQKNRLACTVLSAIAAIATAAILVCQLQLF